MHSIRPAPQLDVPVFTAPVRWSLRVLTWTAFAVAAYLAWSAVTHTHAAGCGVGDDSGCDMVLSSPWSKWLGVPVAVPGLACYAALAALSVLLGTRNPRIGRWINTAFAMLAVTAAAASAWFLALQVFAIGHFCPYCIVTDLCGIAIGALAAWSTVRWLNDTRYARQSRRAATGLMALRTALPSGTRSAPATASPQYPTPSLAIALGGAGAIVVLLTGGQILFPAKGYEVQQVALQNTIAMNEKDADEPAEPQPSGPDPRVAMRIPTEPDLQDIDLEENSTDSDETAAGHEGLDDKPTIPVADDLSETREEPPPAEPGRERLVSFLGGKLTLDVYKHPHIGSPEAPHVIVEMVSYNCIHCRKTHRVVKQALSRYGDQVAVIIMVIPFERQCNKLITSAAASHHGACATARMALGIAALKPAKFAKFHDWLMADEDEPPPLDHIVARAYSLVDGDRLRELSSGGQLKKQIDGYINLFATLRDQSSSNKQFGLPVQILGDHVLSGSVAKPEDLYDAWEKHLGVKPR